MSRRLVRDQCSIDLYRSVSAGSFHRPSTHRQADQTMIINYHEGWGAVRKWRLIIIILAPSSDWKCLLTDSFKKVLLCTHTTRTQILMWRNPEEHLETFQNLRDLLVSLLLTKANNQVLMPRLDEDEHKMLRKNPGNVWWSTDDDRRRTRTGTNTRIISR